MVKHLFIASDHAGYSLKSQIKDRLRNEYNITDLGTNSSESCDYPDYANKMAESLQDGDFGILICGTGIGISIAANRHRNLRAALVYDEETVVLSRQHNDANVIAIGSRKHDVEQAVEMIRIFIDGEFLGGRHERRVKKLSIDEK